MAEVQSIVQVWIWIILLGSNMKYFSDIKRFVKLAEFCESKTALVFVPGFKEQMKM